MGSVILKCLVGGIAGILVWILFEARAPQVFNDPAWDTFENNYVTTLGVVIGAAIGGVTGWLQGGKVHLIRGIVLGLLFGAIGISFGHLVGGRMFEAITGSAVGGALVPRILGHTVAFILMGGGLGFAIGGSTFNLKRATQGLIGGALAGAAGGMTFDIVNEVTAPIIMQARGASNGVPMEVGIVGRAFMALMLGAVIGLFIGLVERIGRSAWIRLILGRNEGREWSIDSALTTIGRSETANIPLFGDTNVAAVHAQVQRQGPATYVLVDGGSPMGTYVNGQRIQAVPLMPGARIQIGQFQLEFLMKSGVRAAMGPEVLRGSQAYPLQGVVQSGVPAAATPYAAPIGPVSGSPMPPGSLYGSPQAQPVQATPAGGNPSSGNMSGSMQGYGAAPAAAYGGAPVGAQTQTQSVLSLVALDGPLVGRRFPVQSTISVGRESTSIPMGYDTSASRRHAEVSPAAGGLQINDLTSTNGTFVNGHRIQSANAREGDVVRVGSTSFRVEA